MSALFDLAAESARRQRDRITREVARARQVPIYDFTEVWMHDVHGAIKAFEQAGEHTDNPSRLAQLEERALAFSQLWDGVLVYEQLRDKGEALRKGQA